MDHVKLKEYAFVVLAMVWSFLTPIHTLLGCTLGLIFIDACTDIYKAVKKGRKITSNRARHTIGKGLVYMCTIIAGHLLDTIFGLDRVASKAFAGAIALVEGKSISENVEEATGVNLWTAVLSKLRPAAKPAEENPEPEDPKA